MDRQQLRQEIDLEAQINQDTTVKREASTKGGEYKGPCPFCGGENRFAFWPNHPMGYAQYWCRQCKRGGDAVSYVIERDGLSFGQVKRQWGRNKTHYYSNNRQKKQQYSGGKPSAKPPGASWQKSVLQFVANCEVTLWSDTGEKWLNYLRARGLNDETIRHWHLGFSVGHGGSPRGITIPWIDSVGRLWGVKVRTKDPPPKKYLSISGSLFGGALFGVQHLGGLENCWITEGEFDAMLLHQELAGAADVLSLGSKGGKLDDRWLVALLPVLRFWIATDNDGDGETAASYWLGLVGGRGKRILPPAGEKDVSDAHLAGESLRGWALSVMGSQATPG